MTIGGFKKRKKSFKNKTKQNKILNSKADSQYIYPLCSIDALSSEIAAGNNNCLETYLVFSADKSGGFSCSIWQSCSYDG